MSKKENPFRYKEANDATGFLIWQVHNFWQREIKKNLREFDLTHTQFVILASTYWLILKNKMVTQIEIAQHAKTNVMMTSNVIRTLEKKRFLEREEHPTDTRAKIVVVTKEGAKVLKKAVKKVETFDQAFFGKIKNVTNFNKDLLSLLEAE